MWNISANTTNITFVGYKVGWNFICVSRAREHDLRGTESNTYSSLSPFLVERLIMAPVNNGCKKRAARLGI